MNKSYFTLDDNFEDIIQNVLKDEDILSMKQISTGWTNIVFEVDTKYNHFFFRFPRDDFWARTIVKDYEFSKFIDGKTSFKTVNLNLLFDHNRPFTMHKKVEGTVLADKMNSLSPEEVQTVSNEISKFMFELHHVSFEKNEIFKTDRIGLNLVDFLDELLNIHVDEKDKVFWNYSEFSEKDHHCLVHGDLNSSNIVLDDDNHIAAIIDLGFAGFGNKYFDIARIIGRCPENFKKPIIDSYENFSKEKLDYPVLDTEIDIWKNIDQAYIHYMRGIGIYE